MKVTLPTSDKDITLDQFIKTKEITSRENLTELEKEKRVFLLFTGLKYKQLKNIPVTQYNEVIDIIKNGISNKSVMLITEIQQEMKMLKKEIERLKGIDSKTCC